MSQNTSDLRTNPNTTAAIPSRTEPTPTRINASPTPTPRRRGAASTGNEHPPTQALRAH